MYEEKDLNYKSKCFFIKFVFLFLYTFLLYFDLYFTHIGFSSVFEFLNLIFFKILNFFSLHNKIIAEKR